MNKNTTVLIMGNLEPRLLSVLTPEFGFDYIISADPASHFDICDVILVCCDMKSMLDEAVRLIPKDVLNKTLILTDIVTHYGIRTMPHSIGVLKFVLLCAKTGGNIEYEDVERDLVLAQKMTVKYF